MRQRLPERLEIDIHCIFVVALLEISLHLIEESRNCPATVFTKFTAEQIERLDTVGAFVDLRNARIAHELLHSVLGDVPMAAKNLLRYHSIGEAAVREHTFDHWGEEAHMIIGALALPFVI